MEFLGFIKQELLRNKLLRKLYPDILGALGKEWFSRIAQDGTRNRWSDTIIDLPNPDGFAPTVIESIGVGCAAQGGHSDLVIVDDPVGQKHIDSITELDKIKTYFDNIKELLVNPNYESPDGSLVSVHSTFWGEGDFGSYIMSDYPEYHWRIVPALKDTKLENTRNVMWVQDPNMFHDECNWVNAPEKLGYSTEHYKSMRSNPQQQMIFFAQQQNNPHASSPLTKIKREWFKYYTWEKDEEGRKVIVCDDGEKFLLSEIPLYGMVDPAGFTELKQMKRGARNAIVIGGQPTTSTKKFITYAWASRLEKPSQLVTEVFTAHQEQRPWAWRVDVTGNDMLSTLTEAVRDKEWRKKHPSCATVRLGKIPKDVSKGSKDQDMLALVDTVANGQFYVLRTMHDLMDEMARYPHSSTKDLYDMASKLNKMFFTPRAVKEEGKMFRRYNKRLESNRNIITGY